jgi:hypothetical protein
MGGGQRHVGRDQDSGASALDPVRAPDTRDRAQAGFRRQRREPRLGGGIGRCGGGEEEGEEGGEAGHDGQTIAESARL